MSFEKLLTVLCIFEIVMAAKHWRGSTHNASCHGETLLRWQEFKVAGSEEQIPHPHQSQVTQRLETCFQFCKMTNFKKFPKFVWCPCTVGIFLLHHTLP